MKKVEADCLLDLYGTALRTVLADILDAHIAAAPEIVHVLLLTAQQWLEPLRRYAIQSPLGTAAELLDRSRLGSMVDHVFGELDRTIRQSFDGEGNLAEVVAADGLVGMRARSVQRMVNSARHGQTALFRGMAQDDATAFRVTGARMENAT